MKKIFCFVFLLNISLSWCWSSENLKNISSQENSVQTETKKEDIIILAEPASSDAPPPPPIINMPIGPSEATSQEQGKALSQ